MKLCFKIIFVFSLLVHADLFSQQLYPYPENGKWGYINASGRMVVSPRYESAGFFSNGLGRVEIVNERREYLYGFINAKGQEVIAPKFVSVSDFDGGIARIRIKDKYGYLLPNGRVIGQASYDYIKAATNGVSIYRKNSKYGYMSVTGTVITQPIYDRAYDFRDNMALVARKEGRNYTYGYINKLGKEIIPLTYERARSFSEGFAAVSEVREWIFIDKQGNKAFDDVYQDTGYFKEGLASVQVRGEWGFINAVGEMIIPPMYRMVDEFSKGLTIVSDGKFFGYINKKNEMIAPYHFTRATRFDGMLARVTRGNKNGFMNGQGRFNLTDKISSIGSFFNDRARMRVGRYYGYYGSDAKLAIKPIYLYTSDFKDSLAITITPIRGGYRAAYINKSGKEVKSWSVLAKLIPEHNENIYVISYPNVPFYRESDPSSTLIIKPNYANQLTKTYQRTATPLFGHGVNGLLYSATYFGRKGFVFSEAVSSFPAPKLNMGIYPYFRERFGVVSETSSPNTYDRSMNTIFFNGSTLSRKISRNVVTDTYFIPFMKVSEAMFIFSAAMGYPISDYPEQNGVLPNHLQLDKTAKFSGRRDSDENPTYFNISTGKEKIIVNDKKFGIELEYSYFVPDNVEAPTSLLDPVFFSNVREEEIIEEIQTNDMLEAQETSTIQLETNQTVTSSNKNTSTSQEVIVPSTTNTVDVTNLVTEDSTD